MQMIKDAKQIQEEKKPTLEKIMDKCDNPDLWTPTQIICFISDYLDGSIGEELPEDNQTSKKSLQVELSKEVLEAMELLRLEIFMLDDDYIKTVDPRFLVSTCRSFRIKAQNLLNALDNQFSYTLEPRTRDTLDNKIDDFNNKSKAEPLKPEDLNSEVHDHAHLDQNKGKIDEKCASVDKEDSLLDGESKSFIIDTEKSDSDDIFSKSFSDEKIVLTPVHSKTVRPPTELSIWKPVSELPTDMDCEVIVKINSNYRLGDFLGGHVYYYATDENMLLNKQIASGSKVSVCLLNDFINQHNSLLDRVERLERIIGDKNG